MGVVAPGARAQEGRRPNIVLFIADDLTWHDVGPYGGTDVRTPSIDRLAKEGLKFQWAFAASPTCTPARSAMYTGMYPMRNGAHANHSLINPGVATLPQVMGKLGYRVVLAGKSHIGPREQFPFEYLEGANVMPPGKKGVLWTDLNTERVDRLLKEHDRSKPLCLIVASHSPHVYWLENEGYDPAKIKVPPYLVDTPETRRARCKYYTDVTHMDEQMGAVRASLEKYGYAENTLFAFTADQGAQWPFSKWSCYEAGMRAPLLVSWPGHTKAGAVTGAMVSLIDLMPTFVEAAGGQAMSGIDGKSFLGVIEGKAERHREEVYAAHTGDKEMNHAPMRAIRTGRYKYIANLRPDVRYTNHISNGIAADGRDYWDSWVKLGETDAAVAKVVERFYVKPAEELYDLEADPFELRNLAGEAGNAGVLKELREKVTKWRVEQGEDRMSAPMPEDARTGVLKYAG
jgi:arylsulfatase A-like enzyme